MKIIRVQITGTDDPQFFVYGITSDSRTFWGSRVGAIDIYTFQKVHSLDCLLMDGASCRSKYYAPDGLHFRAPLTSYDLLSVRQ